MRYILSAILAILPLMTFAQSSTLLQIDESSFAPVQTDVISGVAVDKIGTDPSRRPCARIKMHINRMTKDEIEGLIVRPIGGSVVVTRTVAASDGNGLIIEMTAKEVTRFYLHHPTFGDSNEVSLSLEGNKEYRLEASLNTTHNVTVTSNIIDAEVYLDNVYKGKINSSYALTISDVYPGTYHLKVKHGSASKEQDIEVNSNSFHFRLEVNQELAKPQYVIFHIEPKNATLFINGKEYHLNSHGELEALKLHNGSYQYSVQAKNYHPKEGTFIVNGQKVDQTVHLDPAFGWLKINDNETLRGATVHINGYKIGTAPITSNKIPSGKHTVRITKDMYKTHQEDVVISDNQTLEISPKLIADYASVTIASSEDTYIYINGQSKGKAPWKGDLASGVYTFEARKDGHRPSEISVDINPDQTGKKYEIPAPKPIYGTIDVQSTPSADVYIDNVKIGQTPLEENVIIGSHQVSIRKEGYDNYNTTVTITEGTTENIKATLQERKTQSQTSYSSNTKSIKFTYRTNSSSLIWVYVDGSLKGKVDNYITLPYGTYNVVVETGTNKFYGKKVTVSSSSPNVIDMTSAPRVVNAQSLTPYYNTSSSSSSYSSYSSPYSAKKNKRNSDWETFNIGLSVDGGYDVDIEAATIGVGLNCRMSKAESLLIPTAGVRYQYSMDGTHFVGIPLGLNLNFLRFLDASWSWYIGIGFEPLFNCNRRNSANNYGSPDTYVPEDTGSSGSSGNSEDTEGLLDSLVDKGVLSYCWTVNMLGLGFRHHDFNVYFTSDSYNYTILGCRYTYYF